MRAARLIAAATALAFALATAGSAGAQSPASAASPPTKGALYSDGQSGRYLLGGQWLYRGDPTDAGQAAGWWRNVAATDGWSPVTVPNAYNAGDLSSQSMNGYVGWYRRDFTLPAKAFARYVPASARKWIVRFESVNYRATVWVNGRQIGTHAGAFLPFEFDLTGLHPGVNRMIVRVDNRRSGGDLPPGPGGGWWNYGGILREVYLRSVQAVDLQRAQVRATPGRCQTCAALVEEQVTARNLTGAPQTVHLKGAYGNSRLDFGSARIAPHRTWTGSATVRIAHPRLWSIDRPNLYRATLSLTDPRGRQLAGYFTQSGIRAVKVTADGRLTLNGRLLDLRGFSLHEQDIQEGSALDTARLQRLVSWIRQLGATVIRAHYPLNPQILELADRYGILIWDEVPVYQVASDYLNEPAWLAGAHAMLSQNILENQNHPSILLWSIGNELPSPVTPAEGGYIFGAAALARRLDPTRPVGMAVSDWPGLACQGAYGPLDVIGFNDYFGWFDAGGGSTDDRDTLSPFLDGFRACYPSQALFVTEFGVDGNRDGPVDVRGTYAFQSDTVAFHLGVFATKPWLSGAIYFALQDFAARPNWAGGNPLGTPPFVQKGMVDLQGNHKPVFDVVSRLYHGTHQIAPAHGGL